MMDESDHSSPSSPTYFRGVVASGPGALSRSPLTTSPSQSNNSSTERAARIAATSITTTTTTSRNAGGNASHGAINPQDAVHVADNGPPPSPSYGRGGIGGGGNHRHAAASSSTAVTPLTTNVRSRKAGGSGTHHQHRQPLHGGSHHSKGRRPRVAGDPHAGPPHDGRRRRGGRHRRGGSFDAAPGGVASAEEDSPRDRARRPTTCCRDRNNMVRSTLSCMNLVARVLFWSSVVALAAAVVWYSHELKNNG